MITRFGKLALGTKFLLAQDQLTKTEDGGKSDVWVKIEPHVLVVFDGENKPHPVSLTETNIHNAIAISGEATATHIKDETRVIPLLW